MKVQLFAYNHVVVPASLVRKIFLSALNFIGAFAKISSGAYMQIYLWTLFSFIDLSILMPESYHLDYRIDL